MFGGAVPQELLDALSDEQADMEIEPDAWQTVQLWLRVQTQWRTSIGGIVGLDYPAVFQLMDRLKIKDPDGEVFDGLQIMEFAALKALKD